MVAKSFLNKSPPRVFVVLLCIKNGGYVFYSNVCPLIQDAPCVLWSLRCFSQCFIRGYVHLGECIGPQVVEYPRFVTSLFVIFCCSGLVSLPGNVFSVAFQEYEYGISPYVPEPLFWGKDFMCNCPEARYGIPIFGPILGPELGRI